jgi:sugar lactone lactonase YvrE
MKNLFAAILALLILLLLYLLLWPVPISPVAWAAPQFLGLIDPYAPNDRLSLAKPVSIGDFDGPEDIAGGSDGYLYASTRSGHIIRLHGNRLDFDIFAEVGGRPLGLEFDSGGNLYVANAPLGLQKVSPDGSVETLVSEFDGEPIHYADDLAVAADGRVFFSDASSKFNPVNSGGSYEASLLDILEHGGHGRVFEYSPATKQTRIIMDGLNFANGVAISEDQQFLLVIETGHYRILKHWLAGPNAGSTEIILENLPGFPDNVNNGLNGKFWIGLVAPRVKVLDDLSDSPFLRKIVQRLPASFRPKAIPSSHVIAITGDGEVLMNLQDTTMNFPALTGVLETRQSLYLTSLFGNRFGRLDKRDLQ